MFGRDTRKARPGPIAARAVRSLGEAAAAIARALPGSGLQAQDTPSGRLDRLAGPRAFHGQLSGSAGPYDWTEVVGTPGGRWADKPGGRSGSLAYDLNLATGLDGKVVELHPVGAGAWHWFQWRAKGTPGPPPGTTPYPGCLCDPVPDSIAMTSASSTCNFGMFQSCTIAYTPSPPSWAAPLGLTAPVFMSASSFFDSISGSNFYYLLTCNTNTFELTRIYQTSPFGSPFRDGVLWHVVIGGGNTCSPFHMAGGVFFSGSDPSCGITLDG